MTTNTITTTADAPVAARPRNASTRLSFGGVLNSEWIKLRTLRSTFWCYVIIVALTVLLALLVSNAIPTVKGTESHAAQQSTWVSTATLGIAFSQLVVAVLGALVITGEYGTGMIRSTFTAVPRRLPAIVAKVLVFGVTTFVITFVALIAAAAVTAPALSGKGITADFGDGDVWLALLGGAGYLTIIGLIALSVGLLLRSSAASIAASLGLVLVVPIIFTVVSALTRAAWAANVALFLPSNAGGKLYAYPVAAATTTTTTGAGGGGASAAANTSLATITLTSWDGLLIIAGWFVVVFIAGALLVKRRDA